MPRKLLRVALVAAVLPALTPVISFGQTAKPATTPRQSVSAPAPQQKPLTWWQKLRGQKATAEKPLPSTKLAPGAKPGPAAAKSKATVPAAKVAAASRPETQSKIRRVSSETPAKSAPVVKEKQDELLNRPLITPTSQVASPATRADFENLFPEDTPTTTRRGRPEVIPPAAPETPVLADVATPIEQEVATPVVQTEVATPVEQPQAANPFDAPAASAIGEQPAAQETVNQVQQAQPEIEAFPIDQAAPPQDQTAAYDEAPGTAPQYNYVGMLQQGTPAPQGNGVQFTQPVPARPIANSMMGMNRAPVTPAPVPVPVATVGIARLDSGLYPCPQPYIPFDVGTTMITNPALDPHEMLYAHRYRGLYGPFYHKTYRHWILTPFGVCKHEKRELIGTEVRVNYKSHICPWALFFPPVSN